MSSYIFQMVFGNCGVLTEISPDKSYVEMTGIDAETSQDIAEAINGKGGRYLEAQVQGSKTQAQEGTLVILAAGDRSLFDECQSCFEAMGKNSFYLGEVGNASKMNLVLQLMAGVTLAALAESMALADRAGLQQKDVLEVLELTSLACPAILEKGKGKRRFGSGSCLNHVCINLQPIQRNDNTHFLIILVIKILSLIIYFNSNIILMFMSTLYFWSSLLNWLRINRVYVSHSWLTLLLFCFAAIIEGGFPTQLPLQHMQKDLRLSLGMSDQLEQPLPLAAAANEVYKHAKRLGYGEHDASAVYIRARF